VAHEALDHSLVLRSRRQPRKFWVADEARRAVEKNEGRRPLRIGGREQRPERPAVRDANERGLVGVRCVHDRANVVHACLERRYAGKAVGHTGAALVEEEQAAERGEPAEELPRRSLPEQLHVVGQGGDVDQVERSLAHYLVGDVHVAAARVIRFGRLHSPGFLDRA
jgi:hypothetical protein